MNDLEAYSVPNIVGTPQGCVISPLLCNIALHGLETFIVKRFSRDQVKVIRYADDFVIMGKKIEHIEQAKQYVIEFLKHIGLELSLEKTRIGHSMTPTERTTGPAGLEFLGYYFRNIPTSKHRGVKNTRGVKQNFVQISSPTLEATKKHKKAIKDILRSHKNAPREALISKLAARIRG